MAIELVVGLGNPGARYASSRHNMGFRVVDELARRHAPGGWLRRPLSEVADAGLGPRLILAKPRTYMNRSGEAVVWLLDHLEIAPPQMLVVVDDIDLPLQSLRLRSRGGSGTHNGLRDICVRIGEDFPRLRVGVGAEEPWEDLAEWVLAPFTAAESDLLPALVGRAADAVEAVLEEGMERAMGEFNRRPDERDEP